MNVFHLNIINAAHIRMLYTTHAIKQMNSEDRHITTQEIKEAVLHGEIIEDYPEDKRGHSCLINAIINNRNIHVVCAAKDEYLAIITAYIPDEMKWKDGFSKRIS